MVTKYQINPDQISGNGHNNGHTQSNNGNGATYTPPARSRAHSPVSKRRSNIQIIRDMLKVGENGAGKTEIMYSANMSYTQIQKYLSFLVNHGFIDRLEVGNPVVTYQVTDSGRRLLKSIDTVLQVLELEEMASL
jgi:predicted transcriptional regulator